MFTKRNVEAMPLKIVLLANRAQSRSWIFLHELQNAWSALDGILFLEVKSKRHFKAIALKRARNYGEFQILERKIATASALLARIPRVIGSFQQNTTSVTPACYLGDQKPWLSTNTYGI